MGPVVSYLAKSFLSPASSISGAFYDFRQALYSLVCTFGLFLIGPIVILEVRALVFNLAHVLEALLFKPELGFFPRWRTPLEKLLVRLVFALIAWFS